MAGLENAKSELQEIVEFLKSPGEVPCRLGGRIPKGVLLNVAPRDRAKTLLGPRPRPARPGVPFFSNSGTEFIQMFVGVGASAGSATCSRRPKENSPCILFIDEIDAVGRVRERRHLGGRA